MIKKITTILLMVVATSVFCQSERMFMSTTDTDRIFEYIPFDFVYYLDEVKAGNLSVVYFDFKDYSAKKITLEEIENKFIQNGEILDWASGTHYIESDIVRKGNDYYQCVDWECEGRSLENDEWDWPWFKLGEYLYPHFYDNLQVVLDVSKTSSGLTLNFIHFYIEQNYSSSSEYVFSISREQLFKLLDKQKRFVNSAIDPRKKELYTWGYRIFDGVLPITTQQEFNQHFFNYYTSFPSELMDQLSPTFNGENYEVKLRLNYSKTGVQSVDFFNQMADSLIYTTGIATFQSEKDPIEFKPLSGVIDSYLYEGEILNTINEPLEATKSEGFPIDRIQLNLTEEIPINYQLNKNIRTYREFNYMQFVENQIEDGSLAIYNPFDKSQRLSDEELLERRLLYEIPFVHPFDEYVIYYWGDQVSYQGREYECIDECSGVFDPEQWFVVSPLNPYISISSLIPGQLNRIIEFNKNGDFLNQQIAGITLLLDEGPDGMPTHVGFINWKDWINTLKAYEHRYFYDSLNHQISSLDAYFLSDQLISFPTFGKLQIPTASRENTTPTEENITKTIFTNSSITVFEKNTDSELMIEKLVASNNSDFSKNYIGRNHKVSSLKDSSAIEEFEYFQMEWKYDDPENVTFTPINLVTYNQTELNQTGKLLSSKPEWIGYRINLESRGFYNFFDILIPYDDFTLNIDKKELKKLKKLPVIKTEKSGEILKKK